MSPPSLFTVPSPHLQPSSNKLDKLLAEVNNIDTNVRTAQETIEAAAGEALDLNRRNIFGFDPMRLSQILLKR